jgi:hypothetical protein
MYDTVNESDIRLWFSRQCDWDMSDSKFRSAIRLAADGVAVPDPQRLASGILDLIARDGSVRVPSSSVAKNGFYWPRMRRRLRGKVSVVEVTDTHVTLVEFDMSRCAAETVHGLDLRTMTDRMNADLYAKAAAEKGLVVTEDYVIWDPIHEEAAQ